MADPVRGAALWAYATGVAELIAAVLAPVLGAIADAGFPRKPWIAGFSVVLVVGLLGLWLAIPGEMRFLPVVLVCFVLATIGAELATVFTNAMMPSLVPARRLGTLSGYGWAVGFVGGLISLALVAGFIVADPQHRQDATRLARRSCRQTPRRARATASSVRSPPLWYFVFVLPLFLYTPDRPGTKLQAGAVRAGLTQFVRALKRLVREHKEVALFLLARMLYADGLGAIFAFGGIYAATVFGWGAAELGLFGIIITVAATIGAFIGGPLDDRFGSKAVISWTLLLFIIASIGVLSVGHDHVLFWVTVEPKVPGSAPFSSTGELVYLAFAALIGIASGPVQAASRTLLARMSPAGEADRVLRLLRLLRQDHRLRRTLCHRRGDRSDGQPADRHRLERAVPDRGARAVAVGART